MRNRSTGSGSAGRLLWVAIAFISILFVIAISYAFYGESGSVNKANDVSFSNGLASVTERTLIAEKDTDADGIPDWEEVLWGTDPNNKDTDGDGAPDARGGGSQSADGYVFVGDGLGVLATSSDNVTTVAARELFGTYVLRLAQQSTSLTPSEQAVLVENALRSSAEMFTPPRVSLGEFVIVPSSSGAGQAYTKDMVDIITKLVNEASHDFVLMRDLIGDNRALAVDGLERSVNHYKGIIEKFRKVAVPEDVALLHADAVSNLMGYSFMLESIKDMERDPVRAAAAVQLILQYDQALTSTMNGLGIYFAKHAL